MTYRLVVLDSDGTRHTTEYETFPEVLQALMGQVPWHDQPEGLIVHQLGPWENTTWSEVAAGDEVLAPNNTVWMVGDIERIDGVVHFEIVNVLDGARTVTKPQSTAAVRRRHGPATMFRQMLADAGIGTTLVR